MKTIVLFFRLFNDTLEWKREVASQFAILLNVVLWFLIGGVIGMVVAVLFGNQAMMQGYALAGGSFFGLVIGYLVGLCRLVNLFED